MPNYLTIQRADPIASGLAAFGAVQDIGNRQTTNALNRLQLQKAQRRENALTQYGQDRNVENLYKVDPELAMQAEKFVASMKADKRQALADNIKIFSARKGYYINDPNAYAEDFKSVDPDFQKSLMKPEEFAKLDPTKRQDYLFKTEQVTNAFKHVMTPYQAAMLGIRGQEAQNRGLNIQDQMRHRNVLEGQKERELSRKEGESVRKAGEKPSFVEFQKDPRIAGLPYSEQVKQFNQSVAQGRAEGTAAGKPTDPLKAAKAKTEEKKARLLEKFGGGSTSTPEKKSEDQQYMLPKNGVMVPVTKEVYDAYQAHYGGK